MKLLAVAVVLAACSSQDRVAPPLVPAPIEIAARPRPTPSPSVLAEVTVAN